MKKNRRIFGVELSREQLIGLVLLIVLLISLRGVIWVVRQSEEEPMEVNRALMADFERKVAQADKERRERQREFERFNPNYLTEERAFRLNLKQEAFERLKAWREKGKFVNSVEEFQRVTGVSDDWVQEHRDLFRFPEWVQAKRSPKEEVRLSFSTRDINKIGAEELQKISGIGEKLSQRIVDERTKLNGFVSMEQLAMIEYVSPQAVRELKKYFRVENVAVERVNINRASVDDIARLPYMNKGLAKRVVVERSKRDKPIEKEDVREIFGLSEEKIKIIMVYLAY